MFVISWDDISSLLHFSAGDEFSGDEISFGIAAAAAGWPLARPAAAALPAAASASRQASGVAACKVLSRRQPPPTRAIFNMMQNLFD